MTGSNPNILKMLRVMELLDRYSNPLRPIVLTPEQAAAWRAFDLPESMIHEQGPIACGLDLAGGPDAVAAFHTTITEDGRMETREIPMSEFYDLMGRDEP